MGYKGDIVNDNEKKQRRLVRKIGAKMFYLNVAGYKGFIFMFHVLQKNPLAAPSPNPTLHPDKYKPLNKLIDPAHKQEINVKRNKGLQL